MAAVATHPATHCFLDARWTHAGQWLLRHQLHAADAISDPDADAYPDAFVHADCERLRVAHDVAHGHAVALQLAHDDADAVVDSVQLPNAIVDSLPISDAHLVADTACNAVGVALGVALAHRDALAVRNALVDADAVCDPRNAHSVSASLRVRKGEAHIGCNLRLLAPPRVVVALNFEAAVRTAVPRELVR